MAHNPYSPPGSVVDDPAIAMPEDPQAARDVLRACRLLWLSFGLSVATDVFEVLRSFGGATAVVVGTIIGMSFGLGIGLLMTWWFTSRLKRGRHWMRVLLTVLAVLSLLATILFWNWYRNFVLPVYSTNPVLAVLGVLQYVLWLASLVLLYTPRSNAWFVAMRNAR
ncbi:MAG TPA: hypothetical protein VFP37_04575 [Steroidobacteraceae bacterium]|nr:hypothetical protein [Steroidobacteraceae bacterium]